MVARRAVVLAAALLALAAPVAHADGDPASDVLLQDDVFFPYAPPTAKPLRDALVRLLRQARAAGYPMKVALIESPGDLGSYPNLFNQPQRYADLLAGELPTSPHGGGTRERSHLLVVMAGGFGGDNLGDRVDEALGPVSIDGAAQSDGLAKAALSAVARVATVNGHRLAVPPEASTRLTATKKSEKRGSGTSVVVFVVPILLVLAGAALAGRIAARRSRPAD